MSNNSTANNTCQSCAYVLLSETSPTGHRCGDKYFKQIASERKQQLMSEYKEVAASDTCDLWNAKDVSVLHHHSEFHPRK
jgi:hypothetical protein